VAYSSALRLFLCSLIGVIACLAFAHGEDQGVKAILAIIVNGHDEGQQFAQVIPDGDVLIAPKVLENLRLRPALWAKQGGTQISLRRLVPEIQFSFDQNNGTLSLAIPPHWFEKQRIFDPAAPQSMVAPEALVHPLEKAGFLNYGAQASFTERNGISQVALPWELGFNAGQWLALATFNSNYDVASGATQSIRQMTSLLWDDPDNLRSLLLGDFTPPYSLLGNGGSFAGLSWRKNFSLDRNFRYASDLSLETMIDSPTHARLYSNGRQVKEWDLLPGVVNFSDISLYAGSDAELVLTDAFGRERRLAVPFYTGQQLLKSGLHEYAYSLGWQRENIGQASNDYRTLTALGFHRYGFSDRWTGGGLFAITSETQSIGPTLAALLGSLGQIETGFLLSHNERIGMGYTATARYNYTYKRFNLYLGITNTSLHYSQVPTVVTTQTTNGVETRTQPHIQDSLSLSYANPLWGSPSFSYSASNNWNENVAPIHSFALTFRKDLGAELNLTLGLRQDRGITNDSGVYLTLQYFPRTTHHERLYDSLSAESQYNETNGWDHKMGLQKNTPRGTGYGYVASLNTNENSRSANVWGQYKNAGGIYTAATNYSASNGGSNTSGSVGVAGSLALLDGKLYQGRPITDSFAVVQVEGLKSVTVANGGSPMGQTGSTGTLLIPDLGSYYRNQLSIGATSDLPLNYSAAVLEKEVEVRQRSGSLVKFQLTHFSAVEGNLYLSLAANGNQAALEALPLEFKLNGEQHTAFLGREGYFYLENVPIGEHLLRVRRANGDCLTRIKVADSKKIVVNLGRLACVVDIAKSPP
jgi:outer membrane usher protein